MKSSLILNDLTCIDHAYIDKYGKIVGGSIHPTIILTGNVTKDENVVIDFSKCKKLIKSLIDDPNTGFDHKLWIMSDSKADVYIHPDIFEVTTPCVTLTTDQNALKTLNCTYTEEGIAKEIASYLKENISQIMGYDLNVECIATFSFHALHSGTGAYAFRYAHGLKNSSSYGCQNIAHGHLSYMQVLGDGYSPILNDALSEYMKSLAAAVDGTYYVSRENVADFSSKVCCLEYESCDRGVFSAVIHTAKQKTEVIDTETTIEHLVEHLKNRSGNELKKFGVKYLVVSEGLTKGSIVEL
jgi:6-pyruvoyl-tetrahydropterin synthase